jgi:hypothetical protein
MIKTGIFSGWRGGGNPERGASPSRRATPFKKQGVQEGLMPLFFLYPLPFGLREGGKGDRLLMIKDSEIASPPDGVGMVSQRQKGKGIVNLDSLDI